MPEGVDTYSASQEQEIFPYITSGVAELIVQNMDMTDLRALSNKEITTERVAALRAAANKCGIDDLPGNISISSLAQTIIVRANL